MNRADVLVNLLKNIHHRQPILTAVMKEVDTLTGSRELDCILKMQILIYNMPLQNDSPNSKIFILGELVQFIATFVQMPQPAKRLAYLDRIGFIRYCEDNRKYKQLASKALGIYPRLPTDRPLPKIMNYEAAQVKKLDQIRYIGNASWQLTRSILAQWQDGEKGALSQEQNLSCHILLSTDSLFSACQNTLWNALWSRLYVWYIHQLLSCNINPTCDLKNWHVISDVNSYIKSIQNICFEYQSTPIDRIIPYLILSIVTYFVSRDNKDKEDYSFKQDLYFKEAFQLFSGLNKNNLQQLWPYLLINQFFIVLAQKFRFQTVAEKSRDLIETFKQQLDREDLAQQLKYFLGQLLNEQQLIAYVRKRQISYWQYGLNDLIVQNICLRELQEGTINQSNAVSVLLHLKNSQFVSKILNRDYSLWEGRTEKSVTEKNRLKLIVNTVLQNADQLANKLTQILQEDKYKIMKGLKAFGEQWNCIQQIQQNEVNQQNLSLVLKFIGFNYELSAKFSNQCKLPVEQTELVWQMIDRLIGFLNINYNKLAPETIKQIKEIYYKREFLVLLKRLPSQLKDRFWYGFSWVLLKDSSFVKSLLAVKPAQPLVDPDIVTDNTKKERQIDIVA